MLEINEVSFTGKIVDEQKTSKGTYLKIFQKAAGKIDTNLTVFAPEKVLPSLGVETGDTVFVSNGLIYACGEKLAVRVIRPEQLQLIEKRSQNEGEINAEEIF